MIYNPQVQLTLGKEAHPGRFWADEFVLCDYEKHTIDIWIKITLATSTPFIVHGSRPIEIYDSVGFFHMHWDCKNCSLTEDFRPAKSTANQIDLIYPEGITLVNTDNTVMLLENNVPKMAIYPDDWLDIKSNFVTKYEGKEYEFVFDSLTNQYWLAGECIEKI